MSFQALLSGHHLLAAPTETSFFKLLEEPGKILFGFVEFLEDMFRYVAQERREEFLVFVVEAVEEEGEAIKFVVACNHICVDLFPNAFYIEMAHCFAHVREEICEVFTEHPL